MTNTAISGLTIDLSQVFSTHTDSTEPQPPKHKPVAICVEPSFHPRNMIYEMESLFGRKLEDIDPRQLVNVLWTNLQKNLPPTIRFMFIYDPMSNHYLAWDKTVNLLRFVDSKETIPKSMWEPFCYMEDFVRDYMSENHKEHQPMMVLLDEDWENNNRNRIFYLKGH